jgi:hypothetical protein
LATTFNTNEQQQVTKNNAELKTNWTKTTWKIIEKKYYTTPRKVTLMPVDDDDEDDDDDNNDPKS